MRNYVLLLQIIFSAMGCSKPEEGELLFFQPDPEDHFNYPYFLFIPDDVPTNDSVYLIIEPNNSGMTHDSLQKHIDLARFTASKDFYIGNFVSRKLQIPLLVPVFPRPETDWHIYTHDLDRDVMLQKGTDLKRIDLQLIEMFEDAREELRKKGIQTHLQFFLTGFSASGSFTNRFTAMHPDRVAAASAGGTCGLLILPVDSLSHEQTLYPVGVGDLKAIMGKAFQEEEFRRTPQLYFMGELDTNDAVPYEDAYGKEEREQILRLFPKNNIWDRWKQCQKTYTDKGVNVSFKTYKNVAHEHPELVKRDILKFFTEYVQPVTE